MLHDSILLQPDDAAAQDAGAEDRRPVWAGRARGGPR